MVGPNATRRCSGSLKSNRNEPRASARAEPRQPFPSNPVGENTARASRITTLEVCKQIAEALEAALGSVGGSSVIHRDLKPPSVKFTSEGKVKIRDLGTARPDATRGAGGQKSTRPDGAAEPPARDAADLLRPSGAVPLFDITYHGLRPARQAAGVAPPVATILGPPGTVPEPPHSCAAPSPEPLHLCAAPSPEPLPSGSAPGGARHECRGSDNTPNPEPLPSGSAPRGRAT